MSQFKCKMCGGTLEIQSGSTVAECEYCGAKQTLPKLNDEKRANLYERANHFRRSNEFDKASAIYEQILSEDNTDAEVYWSLVLCRYGIEYVEDPLSHRRVPTVHRAQYTSIFDDDNYKSALKNADSYQRIIYEEEAKAINEIQKGILAISQKEEPFDVFICYKETDDSGKRTHDSVMAQDLYYQLKQEGFKVFFARITLEDKLGSAYEPYIFAALNSAKVMVVLGTKPEYFNAVWVKNEWSRFLSLIKNGEKKMLIPAYKDMDPYNLPKEFSHLQAQDMSKLGFMQDLIRGIKKIIGQDKKPAAPTTVERVVVQREGHVQDATPLLRRAFLFLEDGEFDNASEYAEKVLDINPECAEAYVVKLLIEFDLKKLSDLAQCKSPISDSHNYQKAIRFASPEYRETIEGYNNVIIKQIDTARKDEVYARGVELMKLHRYDEAVQYFQNIQTYKDSIQKIDDCKKRKETEIRDGIYKRAMQLLSAGQFDEAARLFESIEGHKDSKEKIKFCGERKEIARKDAIYSQAMTRVRTQNADDGSIKKSIEELQTISGYGDVDDQIRELNARLEKWYEDKKKAEEEARIKAEEERRNRERKAELRRMQAEKTKKTAKKVVKIGVPSVVAVAVLLVLIFTLIIPTIRYNKADELFNAGKYDEAMEIYQDIGGFSKSEQRITILNGIEMIDDTDFEEGIEKILSAGVPVKLTYGMGGGDFSGATYFSVPQEESDSSITLLNASTTSNVTSLAIAASVPETVEYTYNSSADFNGIQTPDRSGYRFVNWKLEAYTYQIDETFEIKLNAVWNEKEYIIEYDLNGAKVTMTTLNPIEYGIEDDSFTLINPIKTGYTFIGWTGTDLNGLTMSVTIEKGSIGDRSYEANWQANTYTITLNSNGGSVANTIINVTYDQKYTLPDPEWTGHTFCGWYDGSTQYSSGTWTGLYDIKLTAKWTTNEYTITYDDIEEIKTFVIVTFNYNYSGATSTTSTLTNGQTLNIPNNPKRSGYVFTGWYTDSFCTTRYDFSGTITNDMTLYAGWKEMSSSSVHTKTQINPTDYTSISDYYSVSTKYTSSSSKKYIYLVAEETGTHNIYFKNSSSSYYYYLEIKNIITGTTIRSNSTVGSTSYSNESFTCAKGDVIEISLYRYSTDYASTASFYFSGFSSVTSRAVVGCDIVIIYNSESIYLDTIDYADNYILPTPTRTGYTFDGWYNRNTKVESGSWSIASNVTLVPKWQANTFTITFNPNGGSVSPTSQTVTYDSTYTLPTPTWAGHTFSGWYSGATKITSGTWTRTSNLSLTAQWNAVNYSISYTLNGGTNNESNPSTYTVNDAFTLKDPTKTGYTFLGWTYSGQTTPTKTVTISKGTMGNLSYTANWQKNTYTVTFDANGGSVSPTSKQVTYDETYTVPTPTRTGYTFAGWYSGGTKYNGGIWKTAGHTTLTASWTANSGIPYVVNHHKQNIAGTGYDAPEVQNLTGTAGASITPSVKSYTGFTSPSAKTVTVAPDGTLVVDYYYTRNSYTITMVTNGGNTITAITQKYQAALTMLNATREGYTFGGWFTNVDLTTAFTATTMPASNTTVYAWWTEENKADDFTYSGSSSITISGYSGTDTTVVVPSYIGGKVVTKFANSAFANKTNITKVTIPTTIEEIGTSVFAGCTSLSELVLPFIGSEAQTTLPYTTHNSTSTPWSIGTDGVITSTNKGSSSSSTFKLIATQNCSITFQYRTSSESGYDKLTIFKNGTQLAQTSGENSYTSLTIELIAGDTVTFVYSKDVSGASGSDCAFIKGIVEPNAEHNFGYFFGTTSVSGTTEVVQNTTTYYIPSSLRKVTSVTSGIADYAFENCTMLEEINVTGADYIGKNAFKNCTSLKRLNSSTNGVFNLPEEATAIREYAFYNCTQLVQITTGSDIKSIGQYAFSGCTALSKMNSTTAGSIIMLEGLESVGTYAFQNVANAKTVVVPSTVTSIGASAFSGCSTIESITLPFVGKNATANNAVDSVFGYIFGNTGETEAEGTTKQYYKSSTSYYNFYFIPTTIKNVTITNQAVIPFGAFSNCTFIERIDLSENTTEISAYAFRDCNALNKINTATANTIILPNGLTKIGTYAFYNVSTVTHLTVPATVTSISEAAFRECNALTDVTLPFVGSASSTNTTSASVYNAFGYIFGYTTSSTEGTVKQLYSGSYYYYYYIPATIRNVTITTATTIPAYAFSEITFIESVTIPETTVAIGDYAFSNCHALKHLNSTTENAINIPDTTTKIGKYAFYKCLEYTKLTLGDQTTIVDQYAFNGNASLATIEFGSSLEKIESYAFAGCGSLNKIGSTNANTMVFPNGLLTIGSYAFSNAATTVTTVIVPDTVTSIGRSAFYNCNAITDITLPFVGNAISASSTSAVFGYIFGYTDSSANDRIQNYPGYYYYVPKTIKNVTITNQTAIPEYAFYNCSFIETISIPSDVSSIGKYAFNNCLGLKRLNSTVNGQFNIPTSVSIIKEYTFYKCLLLESFTVGDVTKIEQYAFNGCASLKKVDFPENITEIGSYAFCGCAGLEEITFGAKLTTIGTHAFEACAMLSKVNSTTAHTAIIPETVTKIGDSAFKGCSEIYYWTLPFVGNTISSSTTSAVFGYIFGYTSSSATGRTQNYPGYYYYIPQTIKGVTITLQTNIPDYAFQNCSFIESINIPDTTTEIGDYAFSGCSLLKRLNGTKDGEFNIPYMTTLINTYAFASCSAMTELKGGENLVTIGNYAFSNCVNLSKAALGNELKTIGNYAFSGCGSLSQINSESANTFNLPYGLSTIGEYAFQNTKLVTNLVVPVSVSKIGYFAFNGCNALVDATLPFVGNTISSTTTSAVFGYIFGYKNTSSSVSNTTQQYSSNYKYYIPKTIKTVTITAQNDIPAYAFQNCSFIETINLVNGATTTAEKAFENCSATINKTVTPVIAPSWNGIDVATGFESGTGTQADPYVIFSGAQLTYLAQQVNAGVSYENTYFILSADIVLGNKAFSIIGTDASHAFKGTIDGRNHVIRDFSITSDALAVGLFGYLDGTLKNLGVENCTIKATRTTSGPVYVGTIAYSTGTIENCYSRATVTASCGYAVYAGGMVGYNLGPIKNSYASGNVTATSTNFNAVAGGFVAHNEGTVNNCVAYGNVSATGYTETYSLSGGFVAENKGMLTNCYRYAEQTVKHYNKVGATNEEGTEATLAQISTYYTSNWSATTWNFATVYPKFK